MIRRQARFARRLLVVIWAVAAAPVLAQAHPNAVSRVTAFLNRPDTRLDYLEAATTFDRLIDNRSDAAQTSAMVLRLVDAARQMAGPNPTDGYKLAAVRRAIYVAGQWNYGRAFGYDQADPFGRITTNRLLSTYVRTRQGNCVSMPALFLIVADRMGLNVHLATGPLHIFVRYTDPNGADHYLETTSGGHEARTEWMRQNMPMTDRSIEAGVYMRTLSRRESVALMATAVMDSLIEARRYREATQLADAILVVNPRDAYTMVKKATAMAGLMLVEFPNPALIPVGQRARFQTLAEANRELFREAEALGWRPES